MPASIDFCLVESHNDQAGQRTTKLTIATTLLDHRLYDDRWLAGVYRGRYRVELDIKSIKVTLDIPRAKRLEMVRAELCSSGRACQLRRPAINGEPPLGTVSPFIPTGSAIRSLTPIEF